MNTSRRRGRVSKNQFTTRNGNTIKIHRSFTDKLQARKDMKVRRKAERLQGLPKSRVKRFLYHFQPKRMYHYWFSRDGAIMGLKIMGIGFIAGFLLLVGLFAFFRKDLPNLRDISGNNIGGSIRYFDRTGQTLLWEDYDAAKRIPVKDEEISQYIKDATVAIEDKDFFKHGGFDVRGITRAGVNNALGKGGTQGGSTITQQLVKLTQNWSKDRTIARKIKELILAVELERTYSKKEILNGYLNTAPYGGIEYGVEAASRDYFQKSAKDLTLPEASMLAAIPKSPTLFSPYNKDNFDREALIGRQHYILDLMHQQGMITSQQRDEAKKVDVIATVKPRKPKYDGIIAPWFVLTTKEQLEDKFGGETVKRGGWKVITTLDMGLQRIAEDEVNKGMRQVRAQGGDVAAFAAEDVKTGQMVALVGGTDFTNKDFGENNYARLRLPPGSSFKPYDYAALIEHSTNFGAGSVLYDTQGPLEGYPCTNKQRPKQGGNCLWDYDFRFPGPMTLRYALGGSRNVPAVKAMLTTGIDKTIKTAEKMGLKSGYKCYADDSFTKESSCYASAAIGDGAYLKLDEHVHAFGTLSRNGNNIPQTYIMKIEDSQGKTVDEWKQVKGDQAIREDAAYIVNDMLSDPNASYFPAGRKPHRYKGWKFAMKTGTTNDAKDGWMTGYSSKYSSAVWVGYHTRRIEMRGTMEAMTQPIWQGWMQKAHDNIKPEDWPKPASVKTMPAYVIRSHVGIGSVEPSPANDLYPSWYENTKKASNSKKTIDQVSNKLATTCTPPRARKDVNETDADSFSGDRFTGTGSANTSEQDDIHKCEDIKPSISISVQNNGDGSYDLIATFTQGTHALSGDKFKGTVNFVIDGQILPGGTFTVGSPGSVTYKNYRPEFSGAKTITAEVIDSVLYDGTSSGTVEGSGGSAGSSPLTLSVGGGPGSYTYSWTNASGGVSVYRDSSYTLLICSGGSGNSNCTGAAPPSSTVYAKDGAGRTATASTP